MYWTIAPYKIEDTFDKVCSFSIGEGAQWAKFAKVFGFVGVTSRAAQRAFASDLNRDRGIVPGEDTAPGSEELRFVHYGPFKC
jgi:hypothetical protein